MDVEPEWLTIEEQVEVAPQKLRLRRPDGVKIMVPVLPGRQLLSTTMDVSPLFPDDESSDDASPSPSKRDAVIIEMKNPQKLLLMGSDGLPITMPTLPKGARLDPRASLSTTIDVSEEWLDEEEKKPSAPPPRSKSAAPPRGKRGK